MFSSSQLRTRCLVLLQSSLTTITFFFQIHAQMIRNHLFPADAFVARRALEFVVSSPQGANLNYALKIFDQIPHPNTFAWNTMIRCYANSPFPACSLGLFNRMIRSSSFAIDAKPNSYTYPFLLKACARLSAVREGEKLHGFMVGLGADTDVFSINGLINMYAACGKINSSRLLFDAALTGKEDTVTWNSMLSGYLNSGLINLAGKLFDSMPDREKGVVTWNVMINGYSRHGEIDTARLIFNRMPKRNVETWNTLMVGYVRCGLLDTARKVFDEIPNRNAVSWSAMITAYTQGDQPNEALRLFDEMEKSSCFVEPNLSTVVSVLSACTQLGAVERGKRVHDYIERNKMKVDSIVGTALIDMYAKSGCIETATSVFKSLKKPKDVFPWTVMISGLAANGHGFEALALFHEMESTGVRPNGITFVGVLSACSHGGWVDSAMKYMSLMTEVYGLEPESEHYGCIVDALGRVGRLTEAVSFIEAMPRRWINDVIWLTLVGSCSFYGDIAVSEYALKRLNRFGDVYVLVSNIYAMNGRWVKARNARSIMESKGIQKCPGRSSIEIAGAVHDFHSGQKSYGRIHDIYEMIRIINFRIR